MPIYYNGKVETIKRFFNEGIAEHRAIITYKDSKAFTNCSLEDAEKISNETGIKITKYKEAND